MPCCCLFHVVFVGTKLDKFELLADALTADTVCTGMANKSIAAWSMVLPTAQNIGGKLSPALYRVPDTVVVSSGNSSANVPGTLLVGVIYLIQVQSLTHTYA